MKTTCKFLLAAASAAAMATCPDKAAAGGWLPMRIAVSDSYSSETRYLDEASDIYGFRLGFITSVNHDVYGLSLTLLCDGGMFNGDSARSFSDNDFGGFKIGGLSTDAAGSGFGLQIAGFFNSTGIRMTGFQLAGIGNEAGVMTGFQVAGIYNKAGISLDGFQIGGLVGIIGTAAPDDFEPKSCGVQIAGLAAVSNGLFEGLQISCVNWADEFSGIQIGAINYARELRGIQIGVLNFSGSIANKNFRGFPIINASL